MLNIKLLSEDAAAFDQLQEWVRAARAWRPILFFLNPNALLYIAYAIHVTTDKHRARTPPEQDAMEAVARYRRITAMEWGPLSPEGTFLLAVQSTIASFVGDIRRRKDAYVDEVALAAHDFAQEEQAYNDSLFWTHPLKAIWKAGRVLIVHALMAMIGFFLATSLGPYVPPEVVEKTGYVWPQLLFGLLFLVLSGYAATWVQNLRNTRLRHTLADRQSAARVVYNNERHIISKAAWDALCGAYEEYAGTPYKEPMHYRPIFVTDIEHSLDHVTKTRKRRESFWIMVAKLIIYNCKQRLPKRRRTKSSAT